MTCAYNESYLNDAMKNLGEAFDYAVNQCNIEMDSFLDMFIASGLAKQFGMGDPKYVAGLSGTELVCEVLLKMDNCHKFPNAMVAYDYSPEYWCGWILAYYQWFTGRSFRNIKQYVSMKKIEKLYPTLHEASEEKFVDTINAIIQRKDYIGCRVEDLLEYDINPAETEYEIKM